MSDLSSHSRDVDACIAVLLGTLLPSLTHVLMPDVYLLLSYANFGFITPLVCLTLPLAYSICVDVKDVGYVIVRVSTYFSTLGFINTCCRTTTFLTIAKTTSTELGGLV